MARFHSCYFFGCVLTDVVTGVIPDVVRMITETASCKGKRGFDGYKAAAKALRWLRRQKCASIRGMAPYRCRYCAWWHLGHETKLSATAKHRQAVRGKQERLLAKVFVEMNEEEVRPVAEVVLAEGDLRKQYGAELKQARVEAKMSQSEVAFVVGTEQTFISAWERGARVPKPEQVEKLMGLFERDLFGQKVEATCEMVNEEDFVPSTDRCCKAEASQESVRGEVLVYPSFGLPSASDYALALTRIHDELEDLGKANQKLAVDCAKLQMENAKLKEEMASPLFAMKALQDLVGQQVKKLGGE